MRENIKSFVGKQPDIEVVGEAKDGETAVELAKKLSPDVVLMDNSNRWCHCCYHPGTEHFRKRQNLLVCAHPLWRGPFRFICQPQQLRAIYELVNRGSTRLALRETT
ncbi:MAG: hypothetical protein ACETWQ_22770, partial [Phycisphaerae bacterium]